MDIYKGASALIADDGVEIRAGADLKATGTSWGGYLTIDGQNWDIVKNLWSGRIRLPNGTVGAFDRPNRSEKPPTSPDLPFRIRIEGNGDAPF
ncbi:hypothetical protein AB0L99_42515 [Streptomyces sp. NPDC051954]|uniref:hypothetical protein n=1 Tax=Streptomyces sp. NPDC051954 TaxID=3155524 RepID=UPI0034294369